MQKRILYFTTVIALLLSANVFVPNALSQTNPPLTLEQILIAMAKLKESSGITKRQVYSKILSDIRERKVNFSLTKEYEDLLRNEGATGEFIDTIRKNTSPVLIKEKAENLITSNESSSSSDLTNIGGEYSIATPLPGTLILTQQGEILTGSLQMQLGTTPIKETINDGKVTPEGFNFRVAVGYQNQKLEVFVKGLVNGNSISGTIVSPQGKIPFSGTKSMLNTQPQTITSVPSPMPKPVYLTYLEAGNKYFDEFNFDRAIEEYNKVLLLDPQNVNALIQRGYARHYKGDSDFDFADYNSAVKINPAWASEPSVICVLYNSTKDNADNAVENCDKAISAKPNFSLFYYKRGNAYRQKNDFDKAISDYNTAINLYPNFYSAYINRGRIFADKLDYEKAFADFDRVIVINPKNPSGYFARGQIYRGKKDYDRAFADFNEILKLDPKLASAVYLERGYTYQGQNLLIQAENEFNKAIEFDPKFAQAYNSRGYLYYLKSKDDQAILDYTKAIELSPKFGGAYFNRSLAYERKKDYVRAIADLDKVIEIEPKSWGAYNNRGLYYFRRADYNRALEDYNKSIEIEPTTITYRNRANVYEKSGRKDLAQSDRITAENLSNRVKITKNKDADTLTSSFAGKVYDKNKKPIYNAKIVITNTNNGFTASRQTDKDGRFGITGLSPGRYKIEISALGYKTKTEDYPLYVASKVENINPFFLESEDNPVVDTNKKDAAITLACSFEGQVFGRGTKYSLNAIIRITLISGSAGWITTQSDTQGRFFVEGLLPGKYRIEISAPGYKTFVVEQSLFANQKNFLVPLPVIMELEDKPTVFISRPQKKMNRV